MFLIFDTETTGLPKDYNAPISDTNNWPRAVQIAWQLHDSLGQLIEHKAFLIQPEGFDIPYQAEKIHGISTQLALTDGIPLKEVLQNFNEALEKCTYVVGQNIRFDINIMGSEFYRMGIATPLMNKPLIDTCTEYTAELCQIPGGIGGKKFKTPTLTELHQFLFNESFAEAHNATADVEATTRCFFELVRQNKGFDPNLFSDEFVEAYQKANPTITQLIGLQHVSLKDASETLRKQTSTLSETPTLDTDKNWELLQGVSFSHLHNHSQFSILQATTKIPNLVKAAAQMGMPAVALTDTSNMMGAFQFVSAVHSHNENVEKLQKEALEAGKTYSESTLKPIVGCELFVCENRKDKTKKDNGYLTVFLAKNKNGYHNLIKLASYAQTEGFYYVPRIDKVLIEQYKQDLIVLSGGLSGEIYSKILNVGTKQAEEALLWWKETFGDDFYIELIRHNQSDENQANNTLLELSKKHNIPVVATNNTFYINESDAGTHDILLCIKDGTKKNDPIGFGRGKRFGFENNEYYFKSAEQMKKLFQDIPQAIINTQKIVDKIEPYKLKRDVLLPKFNIPEPFLVEDDIDGKKGENAYLKHLTYKGAEKRYPQLAIDGEQAQKIRERIDFELSIIEKTGYPGYFLIVQDFIAAARNMGVSVGPGRGSAAGSAVAYCLGITNIDPITYDLLFERFLNPDRVSMPDIDIDFDDEGRALVMNYVIDKYGKNQVAQIITYGTMAAKSSIRDAGRVLDLPLDKTDSIAKLVPKNLKLSKIFSLPTEELSKKLRNEEMLNVKALLDIYQKEDLEGQTLQQAKILEDSLRNVGVHACGVIITPDDISNFVPIGTAKDSELYVTQFDNSVVESAGLLKMDFLGLKTLTLIKDTVKLIKYRHNIDIDIESIPLDDQKTYELFQRGETIGVFQYESEGMQKNMRELRPSVFADLIAMNALYRPGPMEYIPKFIARKHGKESIEYELDVMEEYLKETYGITVYQEQVMLLSQKIAGFSKGDADVLRKAMGKKIAALLAKLKPKFIEGGVNNGHSQEVLEKIWKDWEAFASYAFNKSHSTCYAWIGYQTAYLKANYPEEYMAAVLSNNMNDIKQITFFLEECKRMKIKVLGPDINESYYKFTVNKDNAIRFGMGALKNVGKNAVDTLIEHRKEEPYRSIFDVTKRVDHRQINRKTFENLALAGAFDSFSDTHRAQYFHSDGNTPFMEIAIKYGRKYQENKNSAQMSLFGDSIHSDLPEPPLPQCEPWSTMGKLKQEREIVGIFISGHPLDDYKATFKQFCKTPLNQLTDLSLFKDRGNIRVGGIVTSVERRISKKGSEWASFTLEDYNGSHEFRMFSSDYLKFGHLLSVNSFLYVSFSVSGQQFGDTNRVNIKFIDVMLLEETTESLSNRITLQLNVENAQEQYIQNLTNILKKYPGKKQLQIQFKLESEALEVNMSNANIHICNSLLEDLDQQQLTYKLD